MQKNRDNQKIKEQLNLKKKIKKLKCPKKIQIKKIQIMLIQIALSIQQKTKNNKLKVNNKKNLKSLKKFKKHYKNIHQKKIDQYLFYIFFV